MQANIDAFVLNRDMQLPTPPAEGPCISMLLKRGVLMQEYRFGCTPVAGDNARYAEGMSGS